ncbi:ferrous iron transport protein B, partial [Patescibacteria group bacterium]|nr:ferrous iron transport protein B [Patescibacteria group bacterium]MBU2233485.1 ferrous iron transport protein B [Patescibacteria group bacterium]
AEEIISREYIAKQNPDLIINVVDATRLERNLLFTLQLLEMGKPIVLSLNMVNLLKKRGIVIDTAKLEKILGIPVVPTIATQGKGLTKVLDSGIELIKKEKDAKPIKYGNEVEEKISRLVKKMINLKLNYSPRWLAIKLLEKDNEIEKLIKESDFDLLKEADCLRRELEKIHGHDSSLVIAGERCFLVSQIIAEVFKITESKNKSFNEILDSIICHKIWGYPLMLATLCFIFYIIFSFGGWVSSFLENLTSSWQLIWDQFFGISVFSSLLWSVVESTLALIGIALPYIIPFYLILFLLENFGYLARVAFLMDHFMHKMGIHGKACIPMIMGFGCNVPACLACRIMETEKEKFITGFLTTLIPCSAKTIIVMGLVARFVGINWAFGLYVFLFLLIFILGKITSKVLPGESVELIMEMPDYKRPNLKAILLQTWFRVKDFILIAAPLVILLGVLIKAISLAGWLDVIGSLLSPITVGWLGLPAICGVLLIFGILRKELILVMLASLIGTANFAQILSPVQMIILALVSLLYFPCVATVAAFWYEFGWKKTISVIAVELSLAILLGGLAYRILKIIFI